MKYLIRIFAVMSLFMSAVFATDANLGLNAGYRMDRGQWTIAGPDDDPNIISDLEWDDLSVFELILEGDVSHEAFILSSRFAVGTVNDGENRDSDYVYDNREGEFSRSLADTEGDTLDFELALGCRIESGENVTLIPEIGLSYSEQNLTDNNGRQIIDRPDLEAILDGESTGLGPNDGDLGPFDGLNSEYESQWTSGFLGLTLLAQLTDHTSLHLRYRFHLVDYEADLYWNLRDLSFTNEADGDGHSLRASVQTVVNENISLNAGLSYTSFETDSGSQSDPNGPIKLNYAEWESLGFFFGGIFSF